MKVGIDRSKFILRCFHSFFTRFAFERGTVKRRHKTGLKMFMKRRHHKPRGEPVGADGEKKRAGSIETFLRLFLYPRFTAGTKTIGQFYEYGRESGCSLPTTILRIFLRILHSRHLFPITMSKTLSNPFRLS